MEGFDGANLGADVDADACWFEARKLGCSAVDLAGVFDGDAELVLTQTGGDVGVGLSEDVGVDAEGDPGSLAGGAGAPAEDFQLGFALYVEEEDVGAEGCVHLPDLLADAGEDDAAEGLGSGAADAFQLAAGDDVEAAALLAEELEDGERGVRFDRVAEGVRDGHELSLEHHHALENGVGGVDVKGSAVGFGELG